MTDNNTDSRVFQIRIQKWALYVMLAAILLAATVIVTLVTGARQAPAPQDLGGSSALVGQPAPDFTLVSLDNRKISLSQFRGRPVLINFWASWCIPCREEMPELVKVYESRKDEGFMILGVNLTSSDTLPEVQAFVKEFHISFPVLLDKDGTVAGRLYPLPGIPTSIFIDRDGNVARVQIGKMSRQQIDEFTADIMK